MLITRFDHCMDWCQARFDALGALHGVVPGTFLCTLERCAALIGAWHQFRHQFMQSRNNAQFFGSSRVVTSKGVSALRISLMSLKKTG